MTEKPKVSVILTSFNHEKYLQGSIESVLNQTYSDFDFIIWDDGSTDESWKIIQRYSDPRIRAFQNRSEQSGSPIRSIFSETSTQKYIAIHHSDDIWEPEKLEKQVAFLETNPEVGAVFTWAQMIDEDGFPFQDQSHPFYKVFEQPNRTRYEWLNHFFYHGNALCHPSVLIRKDCYTACGLYRYGLGQLGDFDMWVRLCLKYEIHILSEKLVRFRIRSNKANVSANRPEVQISNQFESLQIYENYLEIRNRDEFLKIFPTASNYFNHTDFVIPFALAMTALSTAPHPFGKLFGLKLLFDLINDPVQSKKVEEIHGFSHSGLANLTAKYDVFSIITLSDQHRQVQSLTNQVQSLTNQINQILQSRSWGLIQQFQRIRLKIIPAGSMRERLLQIILYSFGVLRTQGISSIFWKFRGQEINYRKWIRENEIWNKKTVRKEITSFSYRPLISVIVPVHNIDPKWLNKCIKSVISQVYENWELCLYDDASSNPLTVECLKKWETADERIRINYGNKNLHIAEASNKAVEMASGEFIAFLDHDDELSPHALYFVVQALNKHSNMDIVYSDEDKIDENGNRYAPYFKPDWNPDLFLSQNYITHFSVYRTQLIKRLNGFRKGVEGAQDWDLALRAIEAIPASNIFHIPFVLYHWRAIPGSTALSDKQKSYISEAQRRCLVEHFDRIGRKVEIIQNGIYWRSKYLLHQDVPLVSIIIPTRNGYELLHRCIESIYQKTTYKNFEILIVDNDTDDKRTLNYFDELAKGYRARIIHYKGNFNYSAINNFAVTHSRGEIIGLLNNDIEVVSPDWLEEMVEQATRPEIGAVGAKLLYPNHTLQHAGVILGIGGVAGHWFKYLPDGYTGQFNRANLVQNLSAVTAACLFIRRSVYEEVGGLDEVNLPIAFNDVDFCIRVCEKGYRNLYTPYAVFYHYESASRGPEDTPEKQARFFNEVSIMKKRWGELLLNDPAYNPNLTQDKEDAGLAFRSRAKIL